MPSTRAKRNAASHICCAFSAKLVLFDVVIF
jgi:hypothetical protein